MIYLSFSNISTAHVEDDDDYVWIVVRAPGGADFKVRTVELPV